LRQTHPPSPILQFRVELRADLLPVGLRRRGMIAVQMGISQPRGHPRVAGHRGQDAHQPPLLPAELLMARTCTICAHPERVAIDQALVAGVSLPILAARYSTC